MGTHVSRGPDTLQVLDLYPLIVQGVARARQYAAHRQIHLKAEDIKRSLCIGGPGRSQGSHRRPDTEGQRGELRILMRVMKP